MKKIMYSLCAVTLAVMSGCQDDEVVENPVVPAQTGEEITFGSSLENPESRTVYDDPVLDEDGNPLSYPVYWEADGSDQIAIYCPQASQGKLVKYAVTPQDGKPSHSSAVTKVNAEEAGLQWGEGEGEYGTHHFYAFYPASAVTGTEDGKIRGTIPVVQDPVKWDKPRNEQGGITYTGVANTDYAFMWAYCSHDKTNGSDVALTFHPWVTILDIEIKGPAQGTQKMSSVQIRSLNNTTLTGDFICDMTPVEENTGGDPTYTPVDMGSEVRNQITVRLYDNETDDYITLGPNDKIVVRVYLLPKDYNYDTGDGSQQLQVRVAPYNRGVLTRTLNGADGKVEGGIVAHKVNKVTLPALNETGPNYWMSSLDPGIYVTELSVPGSKMSALTQANGSSVIYQDDDIATQFTNGIRAFVFQTGTQNDGGWGVITPTDYNLYVAIQEKRLERLEYYIKQIAEGLDAAEAAGKMNEHAFVLLTWKADASDSSNGQIWMNAVEDEINEMANNSSYRIFTGVITPETTMEDVAGKIIFKVNSEHGTLSANANVPALFAPWTTYYEPNGLAMRWGTNNENVSSNLTWFYQEVTTIGGEIGSIDLKKQYIREMWDKTVDFYYNNDDHSMWFMNDLGGSMDNGYTEWTTGVERVTEQIGPFATNYLFDRGTVNATLGITYLNHATPSNLYSGNLIQTIINNNFSFQLRTTTPTTHINYNATYQNGGNAIGWE